MIVLYKIFINMLSVVVFTYLVQALYSLQIDKKTFLKFIFIASLGINMIFFADKYIGMGLRATFGMLFMVVMASVILKLRIFQSIVSNIINVIALAVGDMSVVLIMHWL